MPFDLKSVNCIVSIASNQVKLCRYTSVCINTIYECSGYISACAVGDKRAQS